ncbi:MAG: erg26, C-3 sterol dehydrogenase [Cirrosporium novae-zelandiae]|nr:MAG: erg26, C-3 sterol dehydrogenase [Cirrosporium novae-zelandiae]
MSAVSAPPRLGSVLVIGGCGFLGHHLVSQLVENATATISVADLSTNANRLPNVSYYDLDITSASATKSLLEELHPNVVIHTASPRHNEPRKELLRKVNIDGTTNLLEAAGAAGVKAFVYTSSASVVHDSKSDLAYVDERWPYCRGAAQKEYYSETKADAEEIVLKANRQYGNMLTVALRPAGIFGEGGAWVVEPMLGAYKRGLTKWQLGDNTNLWDWTYVGNVAYSHILAAQALLQTSTLTTTPLDHERVDGEAFNITNDSPVPFWDFPRMLWKLSGDKTEPKDTIVLGTGFGMFIGGVLEWIFWVLGRKPNLSREQVQYSTMARYYNITKAKKRLGYRPIVELEPAIEKTMNWYHELEKKADEKKDQ